MQGTNVGDSVLIYAVLGITALIAALILRSVFNKKKLLRGRKDQPIEVIRIKYFEDIDAMRFKSLWESLAGVLKISPSLLSPDDNLNEYAKTYAYSDLMWDDIEDWLKKNNVSNVKEGSLRTVGDLIRTVTIIPV